MLSYQEPSREITEGQKRRRKIKARHLWNAGNYLNSVDLGYPDGFWLPFAVCIEELFDTQPYHVGKPIHPRYRDGEALIDWRFHFEKSGQRYVILLRDGRCDHDATDWLSCQSIRAQAALPRLRHRLHRRLDAVRHVAVADADRAVPHSARRIWRGDACILPNSDR
jgi:hypothetical protein